MTQRRPNSTLITLIIIAVLALGAGGFYLLNSQDNDNSTATDSSATTSADSAADDSESTSSETKVSVYTDGTYTAEGSYSTPGGTESITVTVTLANDIVTSVDADGSATGGNSAQYQSQFLSGYESEVVGKSIDDISLSRVAGSSLTSNGFNKALEIIKNNAES